MTQAMTDSMTRIQFHHATPGHGARRTGRISTHRGLAFAAAALVISLAGCGSNTSSDTKKFLASNSVGDPPRLTILRVINGGPFVELVAEGPSDLAVQGVMSIAFSVQDSDTGGEIDILGEYSTDGGVTWSVATGFLNPSPPAVFASGASTYNHDPSTSSHPTLPSVNSVDFVWNSVVDLGSGVQFPSVIFRLTPEDRTDGGIADTITIALDNRPSIFGPVADSVSTPMILPGLIVPGANITFTYSLRDSDTPTNLVGICPMFSLTGGGSFLPATEAPRPPSISEGVSGLSASASGSTHVFVWDSATDFAAAGVLCSEEVVFRIEPKDIGTILSLAGTSGSTIVGIAGDSGAFTAANFPSSPNRGVATVPTPIGTQTGCLQIGYSIADADSSPSGVVVEFSTDGGITFQSATEDSDDPDSEGFCGDTGITTSPVGIGHLFSWNTIADGLSGTFTGVIVRVTPFDGLFGTAGTSGTFTVENPGVTVMSPPGVAITTPSPAAGQTFLTGAIDIGYVLIDIDADPADIFMNTEFSTDGGANWSTATFRTTASHSGNSGLATSACGTPHIFVWDSLCDMVGLAADQVALFRIAATDINGTGSFDVTLPFNVRNSSIPTANVSNVRPNGTAPFSAGIEIAYDLISTVQSGCVQIIPEFSINGGINFTPAIEVVGPPSEGTTGIQSMTILSTHSFVWNSVANGVALGGGLETNVVFRIRPLIVGVVGSADQSAPFSVSN